MSDFYTITDTGTGAVIEHVHESDLANTIMGMQPAEWLDEPTPPDDGPTIRETIERTWVAKTDDYSAFLGIRTEIEPS